MTTFVFDSLVQTIQTLATGEFGVITQTGALVTSTTAISSTGTSVTINNQGTVTSNTGAAVRDTGTGVRILNSGGMFAGGSTGVLDIQGTGSAANAYIYNSGEIIGSAPGADGIVIQSGGNQIINTGTIVGNNDDGIQIASNFEAGSHPNTIHNFGVIGTTSSFAFAIVTSSDDDTIVNAGTLDGSVSLGAGNDVFDGRGGTVNGTVFGGGDDDTYIIDDPNIQLSEGLSGGTDGVQSLVTWRLGDNFENLTLLGTADINGFGNGQSNTLVGNIGNNTLDGREGADGMAGGNGNDVYWVDNAGDTVTEAASEGIDGIVSTVSYTLPSFVENIQLIGEANINAIGNSLANRLMGNDGNNLINGLGGPDRMTGLAGDDTYYVDHIGDTVIEAVGEGTDTVVSTISYALLDNLENLTLIGTGNINGTGNAVDNTLIGNSGNNRIDGRAGADNMQGLGGNDVYIVDNAGDLVTEGAGAGTDGVVSSVDFTLGANLENLTLVDSAIVGAGNDLTNRITGNAEDNVINGGLAYDVLIGGLGNDIFVMNTAITGPSNIDYLSDFNDFGSDQIRLENAIFTALTVGGTLAANLFKDIGAGAQDSDDVILYNSTTGALYYDSNGLAAGGLTQFAVVDVGTSIAASDFFVI